MIPKHQSRNYEKTDDLLNDMSVLLTALETVHDAIPLMEATCETNAAAGLMRMVMEKFEEIEDARSAEWVGLGGKSDRLSDAEKAEATGA